MRAVYSQRMRSAASKLAELWAFLLRRAERSNPHSAFEFSTALRLGKSYAADRSIPLLRRPHSRPARGVAMQRAAPQKKMRRLVLAAVLHVAATNNCERATDLKPEHICGAQTNADALRSAIPDAATDALPLKSSAPPSLNVIQGSVAKQKARLLRKADTTGAPLVWVLDDYVGIGNALDAYVRAVIEARHRRRSLIIKSPIIRNLCRIVACGA